MIITIYFSGKEYIEIEAEKNLINHTLAEITEIFTEAYNSHLGHDSGFTCKNYKFEINFSNSGHCCVNVCSDMPNSSHYLGTICENKLK